MNTIHNNGDNEKSLSEGLDELRQAYGQLQQDEPPELLDQAILNSAHRAVEKKPHWMKFSWLHGLTTAAVFVLAFTIILNQRQPVPVLENGMRTNEAEQLQREAPAKKQPADIQSATSTMELKSKSDKQQDFFENIPAATPLESLEKEVSSEDGASQPVLVAPRSLKTRKSLPGKSETIDKDAAMSGLLQEEVTRDESDLMLDSGQHDAVYKLSGPAAIAASAETEARTRTDSETEQRLAAIIKLKQSGDNRWKAELELFKEDNPHYPLPDELTD